MPRQLVEGTRDGVGARLEAFAARAALGALVRMPHALRELAVGTLARVARTVARERTRTARAFLAQAFPQAARRELDARALDAWKHFLRVTIESAGFARAVDLAHIRDHYEVVLAPEVEALRRAGGGSLLVTGHLGDWEAGSAILPWLGFDPLYVVAKPPRNKPLSQHLQRLREARGLRVLPRRGAMQHASAVTQAGGMVAMLLDQRARTRPVMAPFFGRTARCDRSAGVLMRRLRVPVVIGACYRTAPWRWRVELTCVLHPRDIAGMDATEVATRINRELEALILRAPEQYFWLHDRYRGADYVSSADPDVEGNG